MNWQLRRELLTNVAAIMGGGLQAALSLDFTTLTPATMATAGVTFSRSSLATQYDSTGKLTYAPNNLVTRSNEFSHADWSKSGNGAGSVPTITGSYAAGPTGVAGDATRAVVALNGGSGGGDSSILSPTLTAASGITGLGQIWMRSTDGSSSYSIMVRVNNSFSVQTVTGTWTQFSTTDVTCTVFQVGLRGGIGCSDSADIIIAYAQVQAVTYETSPKTYNATVGSAYYGPRFDYNPSTLAAKGLLIEEVRTNILIYSDQLDNNTAWGSSAATVTADTSTSPDGTSNADTLTQGSGNDYRYHSLNLSSNTVYTFSVYLKSGTKTSTKLWYSTGDFTTDGVYVTVDMSGGTIGSATAFGTGASPNATIASVGNGWYRVSLSGNLGVGQTFGYVIIGNDAGSAGNILVWGAQVEAGAFSTSYIPTTSASATRAADLASMTSTNFSNWYNSSSTGTFFISYDSANNDAHVLNVNAGGLLNERQVIYNNTTTVNLFVETSGFTWINSSAGSYTSADSKCAFAFATNDFAASLNGAAPFTSGSITVPTTVDRLILGAKEDGTGNYLGGHIRIIQFYASRLPNATLQSLTT